LIEFFYFKIISKPEQFCRFFRAIPRWGAQDFSEKYEYKALNSKMPKN